MASERKELWPRAGRASLSWLRRHGRRELAVYRSRAPRIRLLAGLLFGSAAWKCRERDQYIGWGEKERRANLSRITNNHKFLILPWVRISHSGSYILGSVLRQLSADWQSVSCRCCSPSISVPLSRSNSSIVWQNERLIRTQAQGKPQENLCAKLALNDAGLAGGFLPSIGLTCYPASTPFSLPSSLQAAARLHAARRSSTRISWALPIIPDGRFRSCLVPVPNLLPGLCAKITKEIHDGSA